MFFLENFWKKTTSCAAGFGICVSGTVCLGEVGKREVKNFQDPEWNKTRISPKSCTILVDMDDLFALLRKSGAGCHLGGIFAGSVGYEDDLLLLSPSRSGME